MIDIIKAAYARKRDAEIAAGVIPTHWIDDVMAGLAVAFAMVVALSL